MDRLCPAPRAIRHAEDDCSSLCIRKARGVLHRDLHVLFGALPRLEVEPLRFEIVRRDGLQAIEKGEDVLAGWDGHKADSTMFFALLDSMRSSAAGFFAAVFLAPAPGASRRASP